MTFRVGCYLEPEPRVAREALSRLLESRTFSRSTHLRRFLELTVSRALEGRGEEIKEATIGVEAYDRPKSYDPRLDSIVRTEASRLRQKLRRYYADEGSNDPIRIEYPRGSYVPKFLATTLDEPSTGNEERDHVERAVGVRAALLAALAVTILAVATPVLIYRAVSPPSPKVVVLPFEDLTPGAPNAALAIATGEAVSSELSRRRGLTVISPRGASGVRGPLQPVEELAPSLSADYVVEGHLQRSGDRCRVTARLVRPEEDALLWSRQYSFDWADASEAQRGIASNIAGEIGVRIGTVRAGSVPNVSPEAYEALARGRYAGSQLVNTAFPEYATQAERELTRALRIHPDYVDALAELATLKFNESYLPGAQADRLLAESRELVERALRIDPDHVKSLSLLAKLEASDARYKESIELSRRALALDPSDAAVRGDLAVIYAWMGFYESALAECDQAIALDTLSSVPYWIKVRLLARLGRVEEADSALERLRALSHPGPMLTALVATRDMDSGEPARIGDQLRSVIERFEPVAETSTVELVHGLRQAVLGDETEARRVLERYRDRSRFWDDLINLALVLDETALALEHIERTPMARNYRWLATNPYVKSRMEEPAFQEIAESLYEAWRANLEIARDLLPEAPPELSAPQILSAAAY